MRHQVWIALFIAGLLAACGGNSPDATTAPPPVASPTPLDSIFVPENTPLPFPTVGPGQIVPTVSLTDPEFLELPFTPTEAEVAAVESGVAQYSGYVCIVAGQAGCSCEQPIIMAARFSLTEDGRMIYRYRGGSLDSQVIMTRIGLNQWDYTVPVATEEENARIGAIKGLITFNSGGYTYTQVAELLTSGIPDDQTIIRCPNVEYRRLETAQPTPTTAP